jgi:hypothetical protein
MNALARLSSFLLVVLALWDLDIFKVCFRIFESKRNPDHFFSELLKEKSLVNAVRILRSQDLLFFLFFFEYQDEQKKESSQKQNLRKTYRKRTQLSQQYSSRNLLEMGLKNFRA